MGQTSLTPGCAAVVCYVDLSVFACNPCNSSILWYHLAFRRSNCSGLVLWAKSVNTAFRGEPASVICNGPEVNCLLKTSLSPSCLVSIWTSESQSQSSFSQFLFPPPMSEIIPLGAITCCGNTKESETRRSL